jgi:hypothetical protein
LLLFPSASVEFTIKSRLRRCRSPRRVCRHVAVGERLNVCAFYLLHATFFLGLFFGFEGGGYVLLGNIGWLSTDYTALYHGR